jgi:hypothetical protein
MLALQVQLRTGAPHGETASIARSPRGTAIASERPRRHFLRDAIVLFSLLALGGALAASCGGRARSLDSAQPDAGGDGDPSLVTDDGGVHACETAQRTRSSVGCEYYAIHMDSIASADNGCFVAYVANTFDEAVHIDVAFAGAPLDTSTFAKIPKGTGSKIQYTDYDAAAGLPPGQVAILFLAGFPDTTPNKPGSNQPVRCPVKPAMSSLTQIHGTGFGAAFRIRTDYPVVAYQMLPYGGGSAAVTGATLLLPTSTYGTNYVAVNATDAALLPNARPTLDIVAIDDDTEVTIKPTADIEIGQAVAPALAGDVVTYPLQAGQTLQFTQRLPLTGSPIQSNKPVGLFGGHQCLDVKNPYCDHAEQQIPPVTALGHEYIAVTYRQRTDVPESPPWKIIGVVDGTELSFDPAVSAPRTVKLGDVVEIDTGTPFVIKSQDADHPFILVNNMTGAQTLTLAGGPVAAEGYGDAEFVRSVPVPQYLDHYVFFTDPTYPETNLVITRKKGDAGFADVKLDCAGTLGAWTPIGSSGAYEYTRIDLVRHDFQPQGSCDNGRHEMTSSQPFGLTVWGWGSPETTMFTGYVSYAYPAGENVQPLTNVVVPPR